MVREGSYFSIIGHVVYNLPPLIERASVALEVI